MRVVAVLVVLALVSAAGFGAERATRAPQLRAVDARAQSIRSAGGALLAVAEFDGPARLLWVRPATLRPVSRPVRLREEIMSDFALSPDGTRLAVGSETHNRIDLFDLRRWRALGSVQLTGSRPGGYGGASGLVWASERRLLALAGAPYTRVTPVVVDPGRRRVVARSSWRGRPIHWRPAGGRLVFLAAGHGGSVARHGRLLSFDAGGRLRGLRLDRIEAGSWRTARRRWRHVEPGLAVSGAGDRAYVVAADGRLVADVDLGAWQLAYHEVSDARSPWGQVAELIEPPAHAKEPYQSAIRTAQTLPNGVIAVTGEDQDATDSVHEPKTDPYGVRLIDPAGWTGRTVDDDAQDLTIAGGTLLARRWACDDCINGLRSIGLRAYDTAGERRFTRFEGAATIVHGAAGGHAYVGVKQGRARGIHMIDLDSGDTVRVLPHRELRLLDPLDG
jgi:hypothetical protein